MDDGGSSTSDIDALHILPLSIVPLRSVGLRKARIIKNNRLEGVVEIFYNKSSGSGQVRPDDLRLLFQLDEDADDVGIVSRLSDLPSYDVYSLRISLREQGIPVDETDSLQLSQEARDQLAPYMREFTRPLVEMVYGGDATHSADVSGIIELFANPDNEQARRNLMEIASKLRIDLDALPTFLAEYGDVYLSLAYYQSNFDGIRPDLAAFLQSMQEIRHDALRSGGAGSFIQACNVVEQKLNTASNNIESIMDVYRARTESMWTDMSQHKFDAMKELISGQRVAIGGSLCAMVVKLKSWSARFPQRHVGDITDGMNFVVSEMLPGIAAIQPISV